MNTIDSLRRLLREHRGAAWAAQAVLFLALGFLLAWGLGGSGEPAAPSDGGVADVSAGPSMWTCSMHPQIRQPGAGDCPICGMDLIPVMTTAGGLRTLTLSPESKALMNVASTPVRRRYVSHEIAMVGKVDFDETKLGNITAWVPGRLDRLFVDYSGVKVNQGDHMVYIYSPELYTAQEELIQALRSRRQASPSSSTRLIQPLDLVESAREKLRLLGLSEPQIKEIEQQAKPSDHLTINSPVSGVVIEKLKQEGDYVKTGERIYTVADLNQMWVHLDAYESDLPWIRYGQDVTVTTEAFPGQEFHGRIAFIQPVLNDRTRTVKVRVNVPNPDGKLKPGMFVHAVVRPRVAMGGRVMDASMAGKWISPMHPEIVKDEPGECDICGMPLVRAESLGFVTPESDEMRPPLVIPYSAALVTGRRAIVYVELPAMPEGVDSAYQAVVAAADGEELPPMREAFAAFSNVLDQPYSQSATDYAKRLWSDYADRFAEHALKGGRVSSKSQARQALAGMEPVMTGLREQFAAPGQPTFEGREIVLGPRAGEFYLVRHGLEAGELVVTRGNFKIDAEIQIQAKPSMMTPEGGGGGGMAEQTDAHAGHAMALPSGFRNQLLDLEAAYAEVAGAVQRQMPEAVATAFDRFAETLEAVDGRTLTGHARMQWKELAMLLGNDAAEGRDVTRMDEADRVFLLLKGQMRQLRQQFQVAPDEQREVERLDVPAGFQNRLATLWQRYLAIQKHLAADDFAAARQSLPPLQSAVAAVDDALLEGRAAEVWRRERENLAKLTDKLQQAGDIKAMREAFKPLSEEVGFLAKSFGFGEAAPIYEVHCPMAFRNKGAVWYQDNDQVRNPYYGASMLKCADRVERVGGDERADD